MIVNGPGISLREDDIGAEFVPPLPKNPRPKIVALCEHCTNRMLKRDELLPYEYWAFDAAATDEMADVLLKMKMRSVYRQAEASAYVTAEGLNLTTREDVFTHTTTARRKIERKSESSSSSDSSSFSGGGGHGRSGSF